MVVSDKTDVRARVLAARLALPPAVRAAGDDRRDAVLAELLASLAPGALVASGAVADGLVARGSVAGYAAFGTEPRCPPVDVLPQVRPDRDLTWLRAGVDLGVDAVATADVVLVPALAVDRRGVRLGRGGGSYDRVLRRARGVVVALLHEGELVDELPAEPHDVPVHAVALPSGLVRLPAGGRRDNEAGRVGTRHR